MIQEGVHNLKNKTLFTEIKKYTGQYTQYFAPNNNNKKKRQQIQ